MARKLETTLWQLVKADGKSRYVKVRKADNGRWSTGVDGEHGSFVFSSDGLSVDGDLGMASYLERSLGANLQSLP